MMSGIVGQGCVKRASLVEGITYDGHFVSEKYEPEKPIYAVSEATAERVKEALVSSVMDAENHPARPKYTTAGGKTGTAQTGRYKKDGSEILQGWFAGFFPAEEPKYILVVLAEDAENGSVDASPVFREIVDELTLKLGMRK